MKIIFEFGSADILRPLDHSRFTSLAEKFDAEEYGVSCPSAGVYGNAYARSHTEQALKDALRVALKNFFGADFMKWQIFATCLDEEPTMIETPRGAHFKYLNWRVRFVNKIR